MTEDYFSLSLPPAEVRQLSNLALAHIGDAVYELLVRSYLVSSGGSTNTRLHSATVAFVSAAAQAAAMDRLLPHLTEEELAVYRRGRNSRVNSPRDLPRRHRPGMPVRLAVRPGPAGQDQ